MIIFKCTNLLQLFIFVVGKYNVQKEVYKNRNGLRAFAEFLTKNYV